MVQKPDLWPRIILFGGLVCAGIFLFSGNGLTGVMLRKRSLGTSAFFFYLEITNRTFNNYLLDPSSDYYKSLRSEVEDLMNTVFNCSTCSTKNGYRGISDMTFRNGSLVIVKMTLVFYNQPINTFVVKYLFIRSIKVNPPNYININLEYTSDVQTPVVATSEATPTTPMATQTSLPTSIASPVTSPGLTTLKVSDSTVPTLDPNSTSSGLTTSPEPMTKDLKSSSPVTQSSHGSTGGPGTSSGSVTFSSGWTSTPSDMNTTEVTTSHTPSNTSSISPTTGGSTSSSGQETTPHFVTDSPNTPKQGNQGKTTTTTTANGSGSKLRPYWLDWVPGWAIALLVLAALILLLLIILFIMLLVRWCCMEEEKQPPPVSDPYPRFAPSPAPTYVYHSPAPVQKDMSDDHPDKAKKNRTGLYMVNP
ncbi:hypothetical protein ACEWY4_024462 [Coilia grayii]|uniref:Mucin-1 n=1 Tax=Coilia grayii TaxID=363190 RepID=A0ABD1J0H9_9TELE